MKEKNTKGTKKTQRAQENQKGVSTSTNWRFRTFCVLCAFFVPFVFFGSRLQAAPAPRALPPETEAKIRALLAAPELQAGRVGVLVSALGTADTPQSFPAVPYNDKAQPELFSLDADKRFTPASNMKLFTSAMALKVLGPEKTFATRVLKADIPGEEVPDLILKGGGDPSLDDVGLRNCAQQLAKYAKQNGIAEFGTILGDGSLFGAESFHGRYPDGWTIDDTLWYYGAEISALAYKRNQIDVTFTGGNKPGDKTQTEIAPFYPFLTIENRVITGSADLKGQGEDDLLRVERTRQIDGDEDSYVVTGAIAPQDKVSIGLASPSPWHKASNELGMQLLKLEVFFGATDVTQIPGSPEKDPNFIPWQKAQEIARHESPPVRELLKRLLKNSDNLYAEMLLRNAAFDSLKPEERKSDTNYAVRGHELIKNWLKENGVATDALKFTDGSGLSRYDLVTPRAVAGVLSAVEKVPGAQAFYDALPIAGVDGTMKNRCKGTAAENNARAKTGTFSIVSCLSGYVTTQDKQRLSVVILTNFVPSGIAARRFQDQVFAALAEARF